MSLTDDWIFVGIGVLVSIGAFMSGLRFSRMTSNPLSGQKLFGLPVEGHDLSVASVRRIGRFQMYAAPLFLILWLYLFFTGHLFAQPS